MNIVDMTREIVIVSNTMFPISRLPDAALTLASIDFCVIGQSAREPGFQLRHSRRKVAIAFGQPPNKMHMVGHHNRGDRLKPARQRHVAP